MQVGFFPPAGPLWGGVVLRRGCGHLAQVQLAPRSSVRERRGALGSAWKRLASSPRYPRNWGPVPRSGRKVSPLAGPGGPRVAAARYKRVSVLVFLGCAGPQRRICGTVLAM